MIFLLNYWKYIVMGLLLAACAFYRWDAQRWEKKYYTFVAEVKVIGEAAKKAAKEKEAEDKAKKEKADAENRKSKSDLAGLYAAYRSLRDQRTSSSLLPSAAPGAGASETITFDRTGLDNALSGFDKGVTGLLEKGDQAIVDLNTAKSWAQQR